MNSNETVLEGVITRKRQLERLKKISEQVIAQKGRLEATFRNEPTEYFELVVYLTAGEDESGLPVWDRLGGESPPIMGIPSYRALDWLRENWEGFWCNTGYYVFGVVRHWPSKIRPGGWNQELLWMGRFHGGPHRVWGEVVDMGAKCVKLERAWCEPFYYRLVGSFLRVVPVFVHAPGKRAEVCR